MQLDQNPKRKPRYLIVHTIVSNFAVKNRKRRRFKVHWELKSRRGNQSLKVKRKVEGKKRMAALLASAVYRTFRSVSRVLHKIDGMSQDS